MTGFLGHAVAVAVVPGWILDIFVVEHLTIDLSVLHISGPLLLLLNIIM